LVKIHIFANQTVVFHGFLTLTSEPRSLFRADMLQDMTYSSAFLDFGAFFVLDGKAWGVSCLGTTTATFAMMLGA
jgi:hypothetical protein